MKGLLKVITFISFAGLILSIVAHFSTFFGIDPQNEFPYVWLLHIGIFVVLIPIVLILKKVNKSKGNDIFFESATKYAPKWMVIMSTIFLIYAIINFFISVSLTGEGCASTWDDKYVLVNHRRIVREISQEEYEKYRSYEVRSFSGHWMFFYALSITILYSQNRKNGRGERKVF